MPLPSAGLPDCSSGLAQRIYNNLKYDSKWQASQAVAVGAVCCPTVPTGFGWRCTTAGTTAGSEPSWPGSPTVGTTTQAESSGTVVWTCDAVANPGGRVTSVNLGYVLTASDLDYLRLLPYVIAQAVAASITTDSYCAMGANTAAGQIIPSATSPTVIFGTVEKDTDAGYNASTGRYTIPAGKGGDYSVIGQLFYGAAFTGTAGTLITKNGAQVKGSEVINPTANTSVACVSTLFGLAAGDIIDIRAFQSSGANQTLGANATINFFAINRILGS